MLSFLFPTVPLGCLSICLPVCYCIRGTLASAMLNNASHLAKSPLAPRQSRRRAWKEETMSRDSFSGSRVESKQWDAVLSENKITNTKNLKRSGKILIFIILQSKVSNRIFFFFSHRQEDKIINKWVDKKNIPYSWDHVGCCSVDEFQKNGLKSINSQNRWSGNIKVYLLLNTSLFPASIFYQLKSTRTNCLIILIFYSQFSSISTFFIVFYSLIHLWSFRCSVWGCPALWTEREVDKN